MALKSPCAIKAQIIFILEQLPLEERKLLLGELIDATFTDGVITIPHGNHADALTDQVERDLRFTQELNNGRS